MATQVVSIQVQGRTMIVQPGVGAIPVVEKDKALDGTGRPIHTHVQLVTSTGKPTFTSFHRRHSDMCLSLVSMTSYIAGEALNFLCSPCVSDRLLGQRHASETDVQALRYALHSESLQALQAETAVDTNCTVSLATGGCDRASCIRSALQFLQH